MVTVTVDYSSCEGCGTCEALCPETFELNNEKAEVKDESGAGCDLEDAVQSCPTEAITVEGMDIKFERKSPF